jgi:transcription elongation factor Elf1
MSEQITITCPHCGHSKTVPASMIPANVTNANCPVCKQLFSLAENLRVHDAVPLTCLMMPLMLKTCGQDQVDMQPVGMPVVHHRRFRMCLQP